MKAAHKLLGVPTIRGGGYPGRGWRWRELKEVNKYPSQPKYTKMAKNGDFPALVGLKFAKNTIFTQKYFTRYTPKMYFEEYINFKIFHYLRCCGVLLVQSFGIQIHLHQPD
jgi:hypothetical protein